MTAAALLASLGPEELDVAVEAADFTCALRGIVPSVSPAELRYYEGLRDKYCPVAGQR